MVVYEAKLSGLEYGLHQDRRRGNSSRGSWAALRAARHSLAAASQASAANWHKDGAYFRISGGDTGAQYEILNTD
jgi:hypothetical protein